VVSLAYTNSFLPAILTARGLNAKKIANKAGDVSSRCSIAVFLHHAPSVAGQKLTKHYLLQIYVTVFKSMID
jgi:hypothetical protein